MTLAFEDFLDWSVGQLNSVLFDENRKVDNVDRYKKEQLPVDFEIKPLIFL